MYVCQYQLNIEENISRIYYKMETSVQGQIYNNYLLSIT